MVKYTISSGRNDLETDKHGHGAGASGSCGTFEGRNCQLLLTYDNAPSCTAVQKRSLSTADGGQQPILTQMGWFETFNLATNSITKVLRYPGEDGTPTAKDALKIRKERGLKWIDKMRLDGDSGHC